MRAGGRRRGAVAAVSAALVAAALAGCSVSSDSARLSRCLPGVWALDVDGVADRMTPIFLENGTPITSTGGSGAATLTVARDLHVQVDSQLVWTAAGTESGSTLVVEETILGARTAEARLRSDELSFAEVSGPLDESMTARIDGQRTRRHFRVPSTAIIGRPGTVTCTDDTLVIDRLAGVRLDFTRAG